MTDYRDLWYQSADGLTLYARDYPGPADGSLPPALCMHGLTRNSADFAVLADRLSGQRRVLSVDQRGRGRSDYDSNVANYTPATYVQDMFALLDGEGIDRVVLVGTSMGGLMSFLMAAMQPERIAAMIINDIGPEIDPAGLARIQDYVGKSGPVKTWEEAVAQQKAINGIAFPDFTEQQWQDFTHGLYREQDGRPVIAYDPAIAQPMADQDSGAVPPDLWPVFEAITAIPMLVIRGATSDILAPSCVDKMRTMHPGLQAAEIPDRGHAPMLDEPAARSAIDDFLQSL
jgi:pimeloyl-ACP methyl ester carboxylesterase